MNALLQNFEIIDDAMADILRQKTEAERMRIAGRMWQSARVMLRGAIRTEHPDWNEDQVNREIARRISHGLVSAGWELVQMRVREDLGIGGAPR